MIVYYYIMICFYPISIIITNLARLIKHYLDFGKANDELNT